MKLFGNQLNWVKTQASQIKAAPLWPSKRCNSPAFHLTAKYTHLKTLCPHPHMNTHCIFPNQMKLGISGRCAKWLGVSVLHPECETADNKITAVSGAFAVQPDDSVLLARRKESKCVLLRVTTAVTASQKRTTWECSLPGPVDVSVICAFGRLDVTVGLCHSCRFGNRCYWKNGEI